MAKNYERKNEGKPKLSYNLLSLEVQEGEAAVWENGAAKYKRGNWLIGGNYTEVADSLVRHIAKFLNGEDLDDESGLPHVDHIVNSAKILSHSFHTRKDCDDRETSPKIPEEGIPRTPSRKKAIRPLGYHYEPE